MFKEFWSHVKRLVRGERAPRPEPPTPPVCFGCDAPIEGPGHLAFGELWCSKDCVPPVLDRRSAEAFTFAEPAR